MLTGTDKSTVEQAEDIPPTYLMEGSVIDINIRRRLNTAVRNNPINRENGDVGSY